MSIGTKRREAAEHTVWRGMLARCRSKSERDSKYYRDKGIEVCDRWLSFKNFLHDMGRRPSALHQLDRIDNDKGYSPSNCHWATPKENSRNKRNTVRIEVDGELVAVADLADKFGIRKQTIINRLQNGWSLEDTLSVPVSKSNRHRYQ